MVLCHGGQFRPPPQSPARAGSPHPENPGLRSTGYTPPPVPPPWPAPPPDASRWACRSPARPLESRVGAPWYGRSSGRKENKILPGNLPPENIVLQKKPYRTLRSLSDIPHYEKSKTMVHPLPRCISGLLLTVPFCHSFFTCFFVCFTV